MSPIGPRTGVHGNEQYTKQIIDLIASGTATSRSEISRALGIAPSTVSLRVAELERRGLIIERGVGSSSGGRKPRILCLREGTDFAVVADLGGQHARIGRVDLAGVLHETATFPVRINDGPEATLRLVCAAFAEMIAAAPDAATSRLRGIGIALPGPTSEEFGGVELPSRMPGWQGFSVRDRLAQEFPGVPIAVDNDANLMALGEHYAQLTAEQHSITVKAGTAIGSGIIVRGALYRGATGAAGDVTHTRISAAASEPCSCGNIGCLETVASGAGLVRQLRERGVDVETTSDVIELARNAHPLATTLVRTAGTYLGEVLSSVVNFFNPDALFLTGGMASCEPFIAAVRSRVYEGCHPLVTRNLRIEAASTGPDAGLLGAAHLVREKVELLDG
ncbi:ROK family transcriptional regulator [Microterricola viridarii]|uniref:Transcriptional regulator n=1 Tax=Microterricola viridarii TaxID=412690 RepID=A0A0Y0NAG6_9MICO|nr:ROK family transcriptional regulator [Microterricola viridarii]AMB58086.1 transcriptional regulator [Microterricola viridarii]